MDKQKEALKFIQKNQQEKALQLFIEYTEEHPNDPVGYINIGNMLSQMNKAEESERFFLQAVKLDSKAATAYYGLGNLYMAQEMYEYAEKMFSHCLSLGLDDSDVYYLLGLSHIKREQWMLAIPFLQRAQEKEKKSSYMFHYGLALAKMNYLKEAKIIFDQIIEIEPKHADALYNLGILLFHQGNIQKALDYLNQTLTVQKDHQLAMQAIQHAKDKLKEHEQ